MTSHSINKAITLFIIQLLLLVAGAGAQSSLTCIDISKIQLAKAITRWTDHAYISKENSVETVFTQLNYKPGNAIPGGTVPGNLVSKKLILRFQVCNTADTAVKIWFFPGFFYKRVTLYKQDGNTLKRLPVVTPHIKDNLGYCQISLAAYDSAIVYAELEFVRTYVNTIRPRLIHTDRIQTFVTQVRSENDDRNMATFVFCGLLLMMMLFSIANYLQGGNREFLYYSGYAFFLGGMLFTKALFDYHPNPVSNFFEGYFDFIMQGIGIMFYMIFMQKFLITRTNHPFLYRFYNFGIVLIVIALAAFSYFHYSTDNYVAELGIENLTKILLLSMTIVFLIYSVRKWNDKLLRYMFWGNLCLFIFSLLSFLSALAEDRFLPGLLGSALLYYEMGLFLELVLFLTGLNHKNRRLIIEQTKERERLRTENQMKEYEKELAVYKAQQEERQRISADMHDELGAGMTAIRLMSEIARNKMKESTPVEIERISHSADEVLNKMNAIIWSMNSGNDTLDNLVSYIRSYAIEYFEGTPIECRVLTPDNIDAIEITGDKRRNIFLCVKETLNNALKHSAASAIKIDFEINDKLLIRIADNGAGIDLQKLRQFGNGLKNIARRMESIGGTYHIENSNGTVTTLTLPL
ncbi:MAG TPA: 7TM diverse intracellular signaling domain-containing protein [Chitinophagaceae bacterium]